MWQLKEPSKPKCVCAHTQFITAEHMANILTHVSRARKTNSARGAGERPLGSAGAVRPPSRGLEGGAVGPRGQEGGARPRLWIQSSGDLRARGARLPRRSRAPGELSACARGRDAGNAVGPGAAVKPGVALHRQARTFCFSCPSPTGASAAAAAAGTWTRSRHCPCGGPEEKGLRYRRPRQAVLGVPARPTA